jgi:hypothetical protein
MIDAYTKAILTVIAFALLLLGGQNYTYTRSARAAFGDCGDKGNPCRIFICEKDAPDGMIGRCDR